MEKKRYLSANQAGTRARWLASIMAAVVVLTALLVPPLVHWKQQKESWLSSRSTANSSASQGTASLSVRQALHGLIAYYKLNDHDTRPQQLELSLDPKDLRALAIKRDDALAHGWITSQHKQQLPAVLSVDGRRMNASVRLRGNQLDHVTGDKWSLKIYLKQGGRINGIRRFSLQAPYTRSFQSEAIIADAMRSVGVLAPRIDYVDLAINGDRIGIMQMTEEFDTPLLESQGRRFGPMLQLDDSHTWKMVRTTERYARTHTESNTNERFDQSAWWNVYSSWRSARPKAYGKYGKRKKGEDLNAALSQWMAFTDNKLRPSEIFDVEAFVDFYIVCEYFGAHNLAQWLNTRLHYNNLTARFEPIAYDADLDFKPVRRESLTCLNPRNELARTIMQDRTVASRWAQRVIELDNIIASDQFAKKIAGWDKHYRRKLAKDYPGLPAFNFSMAKQHCQRLCGLSFTDFALPVTGSKPLPQTESIPLSEMPPVIKAYLAEDEQGFFLTLRNRIQAEVVVSSLAYENTINEQLIPLIGRGQSADKASQETDVTASDRRTTQLPISLAPINSRGTPASARIDLAGGEVTNDDRLTLKIDVRGLGTQHTSLKPIPLPQHITLPQPTSLETLLQRYAFLTLDESGSALQVATGQWQIKDLLILPRNIDLIVNAGSQLLFAPNGGLVLNGDMTVLGNASAPVLFDAIDQSSGWYGIFSHGADSLLSIKHATINATRGFEIPGWRQPAGLLFHRANVLLENVRITDSCAEDAINLIRSKVQIKHIQITNSCSDAIDIDASNGTLSGLELSQSGGDLLDISDSTISLDNSTFSGAGDKAISVGEASEALISKVSVSESSIGLAVKDLSRVKISESDFTSVDIGLMAFQKKPEYGPAFLEGALIDIDARQPYVLEDNSAITLNAEVLPVTRFNLSDYY